MNLNKRKGEYRQIPTTRTLQRFSVVKKHLKLINLGVHQRTFGLFLTSLAYIWEMIGERGHYLKSMV